jgi:hypothetical protein
MFCDAEVLFILSCFADFVMAIWQDLALTVINFLFILTLVPAIVRNIRLKEVHGQSLYTALPTAVLLVIMAWVFYTLELYLSCLSTAGTAVMWSILAYQKIKYS